MEQIYSIAGLMVAIGVGLAYLILRLSPIKSAESAEAISNIAILEHDLNYLNQNLAEEKQKTESLESSLSTLTADKAKLEGQYETLSKQYEQLMDKERLAHENISSLTDERNKAQSDLKEKTAFLSAEQKRFEEQKVDFTKQKDALTSEFKVLSETILKDRQADLRQQNDQHVKSLLSPLEKQIKGFKEGIDQAHKDSLKNNTSLEVQIKNMMDMGLKMSDEANNLSSALKGKSQARGAWGEAMLEQTLEMSGLVKDTHYSAQNSQMGEDNKRKRPDILIKVPGGKNLVIDSKVTLNAYDRVIAAESDEEAALALNAHIQAVKNHMDDLSKKSYDQVAEFKSPDFVLMFMPIEAAYIEALKHDGSLYAYGFSKRIVLVSHTTLIPILRTVQNLWTIEQGNRATKEIADKAGDIYNKITSLADNVLRLGQQMGTASRTYNKVVNDISGQQGLYGKVDRFHHLSEKVKKKLPELEAQYIDYETEKLEVLELPQTNQDQITDQSD